MAVLTLEKRGCDFFSKDSELIKNSDVGNFRVCSKNEIHGKNGRNYFIECSLWRDKGHYRCENKRTGKPLKKPVFEIDLKYALHIDTQYDDADGLSYRDLIIEKNIHDMNLSYTISDILKAVNIISAEEFTEIEII